MSEPSFLRAASDGVYVAIKLQPRSSRNEIGEAAAGELKVKVTAPPVDSAANEALVRLLAETVGCAKGAVQLVRGQTSRHKTILLKGISLEQATQRLVRH